MDQDPGARNIEIENAFNRATQQAIGDGAQVNVGVPGETTGPPADDRRAFRSGNITITNAFNDASAIALGGDAQVNVTAGQAEPQTPSTRIRPGNVFISYSREDHQWLTNLKTQLALLESQKRLELWYDTKISAGARWKQAIDTMLSMADVAVLLVSAHFLASDFIGRYELPRILQRHAQGQLFLLPLVVSPCLYRESPLGQYQAFNPINKPLSTLSPSQVGKMFVQVARTIQQVLD